MAVIVTAVRVRVGDKTYRTGEVIHDLPEKEEERLVAGGHCRYPEAVSGGNGKPSQASNKPADPLVDQVKQFEEFKADKQRELLQKCGIEPGTNAEQRVKQYKEWIAAQKSKSTDSDLNDDNLKDKGGLNDNEDLKDDEGPNTGLPV